MALKSSSPSPAHPFLHLVKRFYRAVGCIGVCITLILSSIFGIDVFGRLSHDMILTYRVLYAFLMFLSATIIGLFLSGLAFLISACIDTATHTMENGHTQTELLRRLVREQSDTAATSHLMENGYTQTEMLHHLGYEQSDTQSS